MNNLTAWKSFTPSKPTYLLEMKKYRKSLFHQINVKKYSIAAYIGNEFITSSSSLAWNTAASAIFPVQKCFVIVNTETVLGKIMS